jgi:hypothetical protein
MCSHVHCASSGLWFTGLTSRCLLSVGREPRNPLGPEPQLLKSWSPSKFTPKKFFPETAPEQPAKEAGELESAELHHPRRGGRWSSVVATLCAATGVGPQCARGNSHQASALHFQQRAELPPLRNRGSPRHGRPADSVVGTGSTV